jgi:hypothetical protein
MIYNNLVPQLFDTAKLCPGCGSMHDIAVAADKAAQRLNTRHQL